MKPWRVGDRVTYRYRRFGAEHHVHGTVIALDLPGLPTGVQVEFDEPDPHSDNATTCYATHRELTNGPRRVWSATEDLDR